MKIIESLKEDYKKAYNLNSDSYSRRCFTYAEDWADAMEYEISLGNTIESCAQSTSHEADTDGITGFMYGAAVNILSKFWECGETLRLWHNINCQIHSEGEAANKSGGVLNPALLVCTPKE
jgi:hypothetical protein